MAQLHGQLRTDKAYTGKAAPSASETTVADVDCQGQTKDRREITVTGKVTRAVSGACVRGDLTAKVGGKQWFHVSGLGNCKATPSPILNRTPRADSSPGPPSPSTVTKTSGARAIRVLARPGQVIRTSVGGCRACLK